MAEFILPRRLEHNNLFLKFGEFLDANPDFPERIVIDFSYVEFIKPPSVAYLSNFTHWFKNAGTAVHFVGLDVQKGALKYLDDSLFFEQHLGFKLDKSSSSRSSTIPLRQINKSDGRVWLENFFVPWLSEKSGLTKTSLAEVKTCLQELINNISDHTIFEEGCIFGQWYPNLEQIIVSVADFGCGSPDNVGKVIKNLDDNQAILKAVEEGFSTQSLPTNRGAGLHLLLLNIVERFDGKITIRSQNGYVEFKKRHGSVDVIPKTNCGYCVGTIIDIVLDTDQIPHAEEEEEFEWL